MRIVAFLSWAAIVAGAVGIAAGRVFDVPKGLYFGVFLIGAGFTAGGLESLITRRMSLRFFGETSEDYAGAPAIIWGLMALLIGIAFIDAAYLMQSGGWRSTIAQLARHPGPAFLAIGLLIAGAGALLIVQSGERYSVWRTVFVRYPRMLIGLVIVLIGLCAAGIGTWEWTSPRPFDRYVRSPEGIYVRAVCDAWKDFMRGNIRLQRR
jgi:hypothetical protein